MEEVASSWVQLTPLWLWVLQLSARGTTRLENPALSWCASVSPPHHDKAEICIGIGNDAILLQHRGIIGWVMWMSKSAMSVVPGEERLQSAVGFG